MNHRRTILVATLSTSLLLVAACGDDGPPSGSTVAESTVAESSVPESSGPDSTGPESTGPDDTTAADTSEGTGATEVVETTAPPASSEPADEPTIESAGELGDRVDRGRGPSRGGGAGLDPARHPPGR